MGRGKTSKIWATYVWSHGDDKRSAVVNHCANCGVVRARLRDVAAALELVEIAEFMQQQFEESPNEVTLYHALYSWGIVSLCEAED